MYKKLIIGVAFFAFLGTATGETILDTVVITDIPGSDTVKVVETKVETVKVAEITGATQETQSEGESVTTSETGTETESGTTQSSYAYAEGTGQAYSTTGEYKVQLGAFQVKENADGFYNLLKTQFGDAFYIENVGTYWKVGAGTYSTGKSAVAARKTFISQGYIDAFVTR